ncbi:lipopolysaccharide transport system permease protein [Xylanibacter ruminicola]|uniref:Transport permease protein n=2 Tax=Xylanibacter ruminicola TaxID=839 RepID=A0A1H4C7T6_XYLRU|nr:lipopolysaccharide transport system permease protein [Xylanibacter ruminicola]
MSECAEFNKIFVPLSPKNGFLVSSRNYMQQQVWTMKIRPHERLWHIDLGEIWRYRDLIELFVRRNIVVQYKQTILGPLWYLIQPILTVIMNMVVFGNIAKMSTDGMPQALFYMAGNICWFYFSDCLNQSSSTFTTNQNMFGKVYFPRLVVPIAVVISNLLRFAIQAGLFVALYLYFFVNGAPIAPNWAILLTPVFIVILAGLGLGLGILISSLTTKYRDFSILFTFIVHLWMYATPIVYPISMVEEGTLRTLIMANPMTSIIEAFKYATLGQGYFSWLALGYSFLFMSVLLLFSVVIFNKVQRNFMDTV